MELNYTKQRLIDLFVGARDLVLKTITAKQVMMGTKKRGNQIINNSDRLVEKTIDGVQYLGNGYLFIKKGIDKNIDALFEKYSDMVSAYEYKGRRFYSGKKEDYELVTEIDLRTEQALLKTNKTTQIVTGDDYDRYHAFINSHYYRYFEKIIGSIRLGTPVEPVHMFDKNDEYIGSICPIRSELEKRKEFFYQPTMEEFLEGEKLEKELKRYHAEQDMETIVTFNQQNVVERAKIMLEEFKDVATSEPKVIKNKKGWYGIGFDTNHKGNEMVVEIFGEKNYKEYQQFWETSFSKELAERLLEKINNNVQEEKEEEKEMTQQYNKTQVRNVLKKIASRLEKMEVRTEDAIMEMVYDVVPKAFEIEYNKEDNYIFFYVDADYTGKQPSKKELLKIDSNFKKLDYVDSFDCFIQETDEKYILSADTTVCYYDNDYEYHTRKATIMEFEVEKEGAKEMKKHFDKILDELEEMGDIINTFIINTKAENCIYAVVENIYSNKQIEGIYAGDEGGNESIKLARKLADYFKVEIIDACGLDVHVLDEKEIIEKLIDLNKPCEIVPITDKLDLPSLEEEVSSEPTTEDVREWLGFENNDENETLKKEIVSFEIYETTEVPKGVSGTWQDCKYCEGENWVKDTEKEFKCEHCYEVQPSREYIKKLEDKYLLEVVNADTFEVVKEYVAKSSKELENLQKKLNKEIDGSKYYLKTVYLDQLKEGEVEVMTKEKNTTTTIINEEFAELWTNLTEKALRKIANKKEHGLTGEIKIVDLDVDRVYIENSFGEEVTIRLWNIWQANENLVRAEWTMFRLLEGTSSNPLRLGEGYTNIHLDKLPEPTPEKKERMENRNKINKLANQFFDIEDIEEMGTYLKDIGVNPKYAEDNGVRIDLRFLMHSLISNLSSKNKVEDKQQAWDLIKDDVKKHINHILQKRGLIEKEEKTLEEIMAKVISYKKINKALEMLGSMLAYTSITDNSITYHTFDECSFELILEDVEEEKVKMKLYDSAGMYYKTKVGGTAILEYIEKCQQAYLEKHTVQLTDYEKNSIRLAPYRKQLLLYKKHGLEDFMDKETGSLVITTTQMKEKTWQGLTIESAVEELLEENKDYECKLFNEKYIKEPHYVVFKK